MTLAVAQPVYAKLQCVLGLEIPGHFNVVCSAAILLADPELQDVVDLEIKPRESPVLV